MMKLASLLFAQLAASTAVARPMDVIEHVVIFMQENRAYDHYFGTLQGVRGFNDRVTMPMSNGKNAFYQPVKDTAGQLTDDSYMLPFRVNAWTTNAMCMDAPDMGYLPDMAMWNHGKHDAWNTARNPGMGMSYWTRNDLPYYFALYDGFTAGDAYHQSTFTETNPNRLHLFSGSNGLSVNSKVTNGTAMLDNTEPKPGFDWITVGEVLEDANITWRLYQSQDNFDDNGFAWFANFQRAKAGEPLFDKGMARQTDFVATFESDVKSGKLPQVSYLVAPMSLSEHASNHPAAGEDLTARILKVLQANPEVYAKTAFILNYDEGGQFFDHGWTPTPPVSEDNGISTVTTEGEINTKVKTTEPAPIGLGFRVPLLIISPWTRGNNVVSEIFDHTSVIKFLEVKFNIHVPTISPWRRAITGNLLSAFNFEQPDFSWPTLPSTYGYVAGSDVACYLLPKPKVPAVQSFPSQEKGTRISRALPYEFLVHDYMDTVSNTLTISIDNTGAGGSPFILFDELNLKTTIPKHYAVESGKSITDGFTVSGKYQYLLMGPNGFARRIAGDVSTCKAFEVYMTYNPSSDQVMLNFVNSESTPVTFTVVDNAYELINQGMTVTVSGSGKQQVTISTTKSGNWYDFTVSVGSSSPPSEVRYDEIVFASSRRLVNEADSCFMRRFLGRMETGKDTISDPAMANGVPGIHASHPASHPTVPPRYQVVAPRPQVDYQHKDQVPNRKAAV